MNMLVGALCCVGRGFACVRRVGRLDSLGVLGWVGRIWLCWVRWAGLGADLALLGALGWVGRRVWLGCGRGFGCLCMVYIVHIFFMSS